MAASADGYIRINTKIDQKGVDTGLAALTKSLKGFAAAIGVAFSVGAIGVFVKESIQASNLLSNAMIGLQSIAEGQGKSFTEAKGFVQDYISDGLVPAADAVTAYKNLLLRGYNTEQIEQVMVALKDSAAFARNASLSMGDAVASASEGLKNENSILVDNAGVTKNVAKMWQEYAAELGVSATSLTQAQKVQAEVNGILKETRFQTGDAAKLVNTYSGQVAMLSFQFTNLKTTLGGAFVQMLTPGLKLVNSLLSSLNAAATVFASFVSALTGQSQQVVTATTAAADAVDSLTESTEASGSAAKKASKGLATFDKINLLPGKDSSAAAATVAGDGQAAETATQVSDTVAGASESIINAVAKIHELLAPLQAISFDNLTTAFGRLQQALAPFAGKIGGGLLWLYENVLVPLAAWTIQDFLPAFLDLLSAALDALGTVIGIFEPGAVWLWENFLQPIAAWTGGAIISILEGLAGALRKVSDWMQEHEGTVRGITIALGLFLAVWKTAVLLEFIEMSGGVVGAFNTLTTAIKAATLAKVKDRIAALQLAGEYIGNMVMSLAQSTKELIVNAAQWITHKAALIGSTFAQAAMTAATAVWNIVCAAATVVTTAFGAAVAFLTSPIGLVVIAVTALIAIIVLLVTHWDQVKAAAATVWEGIKSVWAAVAGWFSENVITPLQTAFQNFKDTVLGVWDGLWGGIKTVLNFIIGGVEGFINRIVSGINTLISGFNKVASLGAVVGLNFSVPTLSPVSLPRLAKGAVIPPNREFVTVLGDQKRGMNIETPLETMIDAFKTALSEMNLGSGGDITITMPVYLDSEKIYEGQQKVRRRRGPKLVTVGGVD